ncbi:MAG: hypothetical protein AAGI63_18915, partial [Planctomycetota bacterium]
MSFSFRASTSSEVGTNGLNLNGPNLWRVDCVLGNKGLPPFCVAGRSPGLQCRDNANAIVSHSLACRRNWAFEKLGVWI